MNILYLGYWNADDPLTAATILPHLRILKKLSNVSSLVFTSVQREECSTTIHHALSSSGVIFEPVFSRNIPINIFNKINDFRILPKKIINIIDKHNISEIIARGAPAGALALKVSRKTGLPFSVESFEPHADYMLQAGVWRKWDPRYIAQKHWESELIPAAKFLLPVSNNYRQYLLEQGVPASKIFTVPCAVDTEKFYINEKYSITTRQALNIPANAVVGIYAGKFGGLYYDREAFTLFKLLFDQLDNFYLILLTGESAPMINNYLAYAGISPARVVLKFVPHDQVVAYLNAANFGIAPYKSTPVAKYLSPVKVGEYWACGLPVLISENVGDEHAFIEDEGLGFTFDVKSVLNCTETIEKLKHSILQLEKEKIRQKGTALRSFKYVEETYAELFE